MVSSVSARQACLCVFAVAGLAGVACAALPPTPPKRSDVERILAKASDAAKAAGDARLLTVVLLADRKDHGENEHDYPRWQSRWALLLGGAAASADRATNLFGPDRIDPAALKGAANVRIVQAQKWPDDEQWKQADLVVAFCYLPWNPERIEQVRQYLQRGGGLVVVHSATWTMPKASPDVAQILGVGGFTRYRHGSVELELTQAQHPICLGLPATIRLEDETYWPATPEMDRSRVTVLAGAKEQAEPAGAEVAMQPMFWLYEVGQGRVFGCVPGHYTWTFDDPFFRILVLRGLAWAARTNTYRFDKLVLRSAAVTE